MSDDKKRRVDGKDQTRPEAKRTRAFIDENLKRVYHETLNSEVPDRFRELLEQLKKKEGGSDPAP